jgi:hypothetical protein
MEGTMKDVMKTTESASGRDALAKKLGQLQAELRRLGTTQKAVVEEANQRQRAAAGRPKNTPWATEKAA